MQRQQYGEQKHWMIATLVAMLGQIGTPDGGFGLSCYFANDGNPTHRAMVLASMQGSVKGGTDTIDKIPVTRIVEVLGNPSGFYQHSGMDRHFPDIHMLWWVGSANFTHHQDTNRLVHAWQKLGPVVISECFWTAAVKYADIVLPTTTSFERNDLIITGDYSSQRLVPMEQAIPLQDEAQDGFDAFAELGEHWEEGGYEWFTKGKSELVWLKVLYNTARQCRASQQVTLPPLAELWQHNALTEMPENAANAQFIRFVDFRCDPQTHPLKANSRKIETYPVRIAGYGHADYGGHPMWLEPDERLGNAEPDQLQLLFARPTHRLHSQLNYNASREQYVVADREPVAVHLQDTHTRGIADGDTVRVWNQRGQALAGAMMAVGIKLGVICTHEDAWPDLDLTANGICKSSVVNVPTKDLPSSKLENGYADNTALAQLEKYSGSTSMLTAFDPPASP